MPPVTSFLRTMSPRTMNWSQCALTSPFEGSGSNDRRMYDGLDREGPEFRGTHYILLMEVYRRMRGPRTIQSSPVFPPGTEQARLRKAGDLFFAIAEDETGRKIQLMVGATAPSSQLDVPSCLSG